MCVMDVLTEHESPEMEEEVVEGHPGQVEVSLEEQFPQEQEN